MKIKVMVSLVVLGLYCSVIDGLVVINHKWVYVGIAYLIFFMIFSKEISKEIKDKSLFSINAEKQNSKIKKRSFTSFLLIILTPSLFSIFTMFIISSSYTKIFGEKLVYKAEIYNKEKKSIGRSRFYYVYVRSIERGNERLDDYNLYTKLSTGTKITVVKYQSALGSFIPYDEIIWVVGNTK